MFISNLTIENWVGNKDESSFIENPNWQEIKTAILELNGETKTLVTLGADEETYMSIGGGEAGKYIVNVTFDNLSFYNLVNFSKSEEIETLVVGGQAGDYSAKMWVDLQSVLLAAKTFVELGKLEDSVTWEEEKTFAVL